MTTPSYPGGYFGQGGAKQHNAVSAWRPRSQREALYDFITSLPHGASVLDVGCGEGRALYRMKELRPDLRLSGLDLADVNSLIPPDVAFTLGSAENLSQLYQPGTFDAVVCRHVIEHLVSPLELVSGISKILRSGGKVFMETPNWVRMYMPFSYMYFWNDYTHIHPYTPFSMRRMLLEFGFSVEALHTLSSSTWRTPAVLKKAKTSEKKALADTPPLSSFVYTHKQSGFVTKGFAWLVNPLMRDLLVAIGTKN